MSGQPGGLGATVLSSYACSCRRCDRDSFEPAIKVGLKLLMITEPEISF